jgi:Delta3-Delta2-enoyl-CoA isomerase
MSCEYRVMLPNYTIGLNETQLGIVAPTWFMATMKNTISPRRTEMALTLGTLFKTDEALRIGLIDEIAKDKAEAIAKCEAYLHKFDKMPRHGRDMTKISIREADIEQLQRNRESDIESFVVNVNNEKIQKSLGMYVSYLKWRKRLKPVNDLVKFVRGMFKPQKKKKE